jgi:hypothetical protein
MINIRSDFRIVALLTGLLFIQIANLRSQTVYYHIQNEALYDYLDECANAGLIQLNSAVKPYSRMFIARQLASLDTLRSQLNKRQQKDLDFYLKDFNKERMPDKHFDRRFDLFYYKDSLFTFSANLILGAEYHMNENGSAPFWWNGAEIFSYVGKLGVYVSLRDHHDKELLVQDRYLTLRRGGNYKGGGDFEEIRGGITWSWKWGNVGIIMDHNTWGSGYHGSNIQSGRTPSIARINLQMKPIRWFEFNYYHGWLVSEVVDSNRSYYSGSQPTATYREVYHPKYLAANMFTFTPARKLNISVGNSIIYTDIGVHPAYLIPVFFFKAVDHTLNAGGIDNMNSQMYLDVSSRNIRNLHLYGTWYVDEVNISHMFEPERHSNYFSWKLGGRLSNFPMKNLDITGEWTRSNANVFRHPVSTLTYESNQYNLGHYLTDNAREYYFAVGYRPLRGLHLMLSYLFAQKGPDHTELGTDRWGIPFMESVEWENKTFRFRARYQIINDAYFYGEYRFSNISGNELEKYTHPLWHGKTNTFTIGANFGF